MINFSVQVHLKGRSPLLWKAVRGRIPLDHTCSFRRVTHTLEIPSVRLSFGLCSQVVTSGYNTMQSGSIHSLQAPPSPQALSSTRTHGDIDKHHNMAPNEVPPDPSQYYFTASHHRDYLCVFGMLSYRSLLNVFSLFIG